MFKQKLVNAVAPRVTTNTAMFSQLLHLAVRMVLTVFCFSIALGLWWWEVRRPERHGLPPLQGARRSGRKGPWTVRGDGLDPGRVPHPTLRYQPPIDAGLNAELKSSRTPDGIH
jgi:hypothetical protein